MWNSTFFILCLLLPLMHCIFFLMSTCGYRYMNRKTRKKSYQKEKKTTDTLVTGTSVRIKEGERQMGDDKTSLLVPSSPDSSVTGDKRVWQRPAVIWHTRERYQQKSRHRDRFEEMNENLCIRFNTGTMHPKKYTCFLTMMACIKDFLVFSSSISCPSISLTVRSMVACLAFTANILHFEFSDAICSW